MSSFLIVNTRDGQNPNVLGASYNAAGVFAPQLAVSSNNQIPSALVYTQWNLVQITPGFFQLQIADNKGLAYCLCVSNAASGAGCVLVPANSSDLNQYYSIWAFPYPGQGRIILMYNQSKEDALSLDAGSYPNLMVYNFVSSVNQTWQFGTTMNNLSPNPPV